MQFLVIAFGLIGISLLSLSSPHGLHIFAASHSNLVTTCERHMKGRSITEHQYP
jgi:hypothetical protein